jgi:hypothetical protein
VGAFHKFVDGKLGDAVDDAEATYYKEWLASDAAKLKEHCQADIDKEKEIADEAKKDARKFTPPIFTDLDNPHVMYLKDDKTYSGRAAEATPAALAFAPASRALTTRPR